MSDLGTSNPAKSDWKPATESSLRMSGRARTLDPVPYLHGDANRFTWAWPPRIASRSEIFRDPIAGVLAAVVLIANIISFGGLMFPGDLSASISTVIWAMLSAARLVACGSGWRPPCRRLRPELIHRQAPYSSC